MSSDRRRAPRYQFIADAEVMDIESGAKVKVKTGDLSIGGCFLCTASPSTEGTVIRVAIFLGGEAFSALGRVVFVFPNMGMGIVFTGVEPRPQETLEKWLSELDRLRSCGPAIESRVGSTRRS
jgi:hypothetical protein